MDTIIAKKDALERLHGVRFDEKYLAIWVTSTGCTGKEDFEIRVGKGTTGKISFSMEILRITPDLCKTTTHVVELNFSWEELGLDPAQLKNASVKVANPFGVLR
ncbi:MULTISPECIES: hypothetical protein [Massilia]|uniref:Uncharacterized protein n=2 Tax=Massilia TaxID=149698 RepID=A0ABY4A9N5_9BURK|nr:MULTISPECIES: hypothetical protein [Massilia]NHZ38607.1 hypothetical protein [Massilia aquatica]UOD31510.1 hypothetical protein INH39_07390 [Massilia violaceinigra]